LYPCFSPVMLELFGHLGVAADAPQLPSCVQNVTATVFENNFHESGAY